MVKLFSLTHFVWVVILTYQVVTFVFYGFLGMWSSSFFLGNFVGPTVSGILVDYYGFRMTTLVFFVVYLVNIFVDVGELFFTIRSRRREYEQLK